MEVSIIRLSIICSQVWRRTSSKKQSVLSGRSARHMLFPTTRPTCGNRTEKRCPHFTRSLRHYGKRAWFPDLSTRGRPRTERRPKLGHRHKAHYRVFRAFHTLRTWMLPLTYLSTRCHKCVNVIMRCRTFNALSVVDSQFPSWKEKRIRHEAGQKVRPLMITFTLRRIITHSRLVLRSQKCAL